MKKVVFISSVRPPSEVCSSTDIMTNNIIEGLAKNDVELTLVLLYDDKKEIINLRKYYMNFTSKVLFLPRFFRDGQSKYTFLFGSLSVLVFRKKYEYCAHDILHKLTNVDLIIANKVTIDEIIYGDYFSKKIIGASYYQYWSDPMAVAGILPDELKKSFIRQLFKFIERGAIKKADRIIYGTKVLLDVQKDIYPTVASKMYYIDISYSKKSLINKGNSIGFKMLYAGNYYSNIRNIQPLLKAVSKMNMVTLDIYGNGDASIPTQNVNYCGRISVDQLDSVREEYDCEICILNHSCLQIPGKIFYNMYINIPIIVICDGPYIDQITDYLSQYNRFELCYNNENSITSMLNHVINNNNDLDLVYINKNFSKKKIATDLILGGKI